jgi:hypothetical protein
LYIAGEGSHVSKVESCLDINNSKPKLKEAPTALFKRLNFFSLFFFELKVEGSTNVFKANYLFVDDDRIMPSRDRYCQ